MRRNDPLVQAREVDPIKLLSPPPPPPFSALLRVLLTLRAKKHFGSNGTAVRDEMRERRARRDAARRGAANPKPKRIENRPRAI